MTHHSTVSTVRPGSGTRPALTAFAGALGAALLAACTATTSPTSTVAGSGVRLSPGAEADLAGLPGACQMRDNDLPDPACTPGATDPEVTQANLGRTICRRGYTARVRPPLSYTALLKLSLMARYGDSGRPASYELDHLVPLEVGGSPDSVRNLWPQPRDVHPGSLDKDHLENLLHDQVCAGQVSLARAQQEFEANWLQAWEQAGKP